MPYALPLCVLPSRLLSLLGPPKRQPPWPLPSPGALRAQDHSEDTDSLLVRREYLSGLWLHDAAASASAISTRSTVRAPEGCDSAMLGPVGPGAPPAECPEPTIIRRGQRCLISRSGGGGTFRLLDETPWAAYSTVAHPRSPKPSTTTPHKTPPVGAPEKWKGVKYEHIYYICRRAMSTRAARACGAAARAG